MASSEMHAAVEGSEVHDKDRPSQKPTAEDNLFDHITEEPQGQLWMVDQVQLSEKMLPSSTSFILQFMARLIFMLTSFI